MNGVNAASGIPSRNLGLSSTRSTSVGRSRIKAAQLLLMGLFWLSGVVHAATSDYGPWIPINDGNRNLIQIAFKKIPTNCNGNSCLYYWKFLNGYPGNATVECYILTVDGLGKQNR